MAAGLSIKIYSFLNFKLNDSTKITLCWARKVDLCWFSKNLPGLKTKTNCEIIENPTTQMLMNWFQNSSLNAPGLFRQKMKMYLRRIIPSRKSNCWVVIEFLKTNSMKQTHSGSGPKMYLLQKIVCNFLIGIRQEIDFTYNSLQIFDLFCLQLLQMF